MSQDKERCCLCGGKIEKGGCDPYPIAEEGRCCHACNWTVVLPKRIELSKRENETDVDRDTQ